MDYISAKEIAKRWGIGVRRVQICCAEGKVPGAIFMGKQWIIPENTIRPVDGRTKYAPKLDKDKTYVFPIFLFSQKYNQDYSTLSPFEKKLFDAQEEHVRRNLFESIKICRNLLADKDVPTCFVMGAYATLAYNYLILGLPKEFNQALEEVKHIYEKEKVFTEDYKLIYYGLLSATQFSSTYSTKINIDNLSRQSLTYYKYLLYLSYTIDDVERSLFVLHEMETFVKELEYQGDNPSLLYMLCILSSHYQELGMIDKAQKTAQKIVLLAEKHNWYNVVAKFYAVINKLINKKLSQVNKPKIKELRDITSENLLNWRIIAQSFTEQVPFSKVDIEDVSLFIMLSHNVTNRKISVIQGTTTAEVNKQIKKLCDKLNLNSKKDLVKYAVQQIKQFAKTPIDIPKN